ncbi:universal stress protein [Streptomyces sp. NPDC001100]
MLASVMAGVDGSPESLAAAEWAAREALRRGLPLRLVHAWDWHPRRGEREPDSAVQRYLARRALQQAEDRVRAACPDVRLYDDQVEGPAIPSLLRLAEGAELVVLGSRGLSGVAGFVVGSVAQGVVARATVPVVLVRAGEEEADEHLPATGDSGPRPGYRDVVLAVDLDAPCDEVIEFAFEAARLRGARLRVVHAWQTPVLGLGPGEVDLLNDPRRAEERQAALAGALRLWRDKYAGVEVVETVTKDRPRTALIRAASGASLLVVGRRTVERPVGRRVGPVTHAAIHDVDCPVAVVPHF